jgi:hypothetical protein
MVKVCKGLQNSISDITETPFSNSFLTIETQEYPGFITTSAFKINRRMLFFSPWN